MEPNLQSLAAFRSGYIYSQGYTAW